MRISLPYGVGTISLLFDAAPSPEQLVDWYQTVTYWASLLPARDLGTKSVGVVDAAPGARLVTLPNSNRAPATTAFTHPNDESASADPAPVTKSELRTAFTEYINVHGPELAKSLLRTYGVERLAQLPPERYIEFYQQMVGA
jgi:hypothetical protein